MDSILKPEHLGLALEVNAIRDISPDSIYQGIKKASREAFNEVRAYDKKVKMSVSVQVDWAWGKLQNTSYLGVEKDFIDFPFMEELGLSSYPYFCFDKPQDIPLDYYSRVVNGRSLPVFIAEGGWSSETVGQFTQTQEKQAAYFFHHSKLLDNVKATALFQLTFTDIDMSVVPSGTPSNLSLFAFMGLIDKDLKSKPALVAWDKVFKKTLKE